MRSSSCEKNGLARQHEKGRPVAALKKLSVFWTRLSSKFQVTTADNLSSTQQSVMRLGRGKVKETNEEKHQEDAGITSLV
jgi:hypothetical protein